MKIIHAMAGAAIGGAEGFFERLTIGLHQCGLEQKLIIRANPARTHKLTEAGLSVTEAPFGGIFDLRTRPIFRRLSHEFKPDLVLTWMNRATKLIPAGSYVKAARLGGYYDLKYYRDCDHLIGNTQGIVDWIGAQGWPRDRVH